MGGVQCLEGLSWIGFERVRLSHEYLNTIFLYDLSDQGVCRIDKSELVPVKFIFPTFIEREAALPQFFESL